MEENAQTHFLEKLKSEIETLKDSVESISQAKASLTPELSQVSQSIEALLGSQQSQPLFHFPLILSKVLSNPDIGAIVFGPAGEKLLANERADELLWGTSFKTSRLEKDPAARAFFNNKGTRLAYEELPWNRAIEQKKDLEEEIITQEKTLKVRCQLLKGAGTAEIGGLITFIIDESEHVALGKELEELSQEIQAKLEQLVVVAQELDLLNSTLEELKNKDLRD